MRLRSTACSITAMNQVVACGRLPPGLQAQVEGLFVSPLLRGAGWSRVVRQHLMTAKD